MIKLYEAEDLNKVQRPTVIELQFTTISNIKEINVKIDLREILKEEVFDLNINVIDFGEDDLHDFVCKLKGRVNLLKGQTEEQRQNIVLNKLSEIINILYSNVDWKKRVCKIS